MIYLLIILLCGLLNAQVVEITSVAHSVVSGYSVYYQMQDRELYRQRDAEHIRYNQLWHHTQGVELGLSIALGGLIALNNDNLLDAGKDLLLFSAIRWVVRDGVYNSLNGNPFFYQSPNTTAMLEPFGTWYVKIGYLITAILIRELL